MVASGDLTLATMKLMLRGDLSDARQMRGERPVKVVP
jgi:hypothetical protein